MKLETLQESMVKALKDGDKFRKQVLSGLVSAVKTAAINKCVGSNITESLVDETLIKCQKTAQESVDSCPTDREEMLADYKAQLEIIKEFAPQLVTDEAQIKQAIDLIIRKNFPDKEPSELKKGIVMKAVMPELRAANVDMRIANQMIGKIFG